MVAAAVTGVATVVAVAYVLKQWRRRSDKRRRMTLSRLTRFRRECATPVQKLWQIADALVSEMQSALTGTSEGIKLLLSYGLPLLDTCCSRFAILVKAWIMAISLLITQPILMQSLLSFRLCDYA